MKILYLKDAAKCKMLHHKVSFFKNRLIYKGKHKLYRIIKGIYPHVKQPQKPHYY